MSGRGRPHKAGIPKTKGAKSTTAPEVNQGLCQPRCSEKDSTKEKQNSTKKEQKPKEREQKKPNHSVEKPAVQSMRKETTTKNFTEKTVNQQRMPTDNIKDLVPDTKTKTSAKSTEPGPESAGEITQMQPETLKESTTDSIKTTKPKGCSGQAKIPDNSEQDTILTKPVKPKNTRATRKEKTHAGKAANNIKVETEQSAQEVTKMQPETPTNNEKIRKAKPCAGKTKSQDTPEETSETQPEKPGYEDTASKDSILTETLEKLKIKKNDKSQAAEVINNIIFHIMEHFKKKTHCFKEVERLTTGSYYENVKISNPDEFDVMLAIPVERVDIKPFGEDAAFYTVTLKRGNSPLKKFEKTDVLSSSDMLEEFRTEVKKCIKEFQAWEITRKKRGCPAVTLTTKVQSITISLDVVLCVKVKSSWPSFTEDGFQIDKWLGTKVKKNYKQVPYYLVPKYEGRGDKEHDGVSARDCWRISFSHVEKGILNNHGSEKTCCEKVGEHCCRKSCLKLLKHLLSLLKNEDSSFDKFFSYQAKTTLFHSCCTRAKDSDWRDKDLNQCFQQLLEDFIGHLKNHDLPNFFIPNQNLLSAVNQSTCNKLADRIEEELQNGFPVFKR